MSPLRGRQSKSVVIVDIGSASVRAGLVRVAPSTMPEFVMFSRQRFHPEGSDRNTVEKKMLLALSLVLKELKPEGSIERIVVTLSSPWAVSRISSRKEERGEKFTFEEDLAIRFVREESEWFEKDLESRMGEKCRVFDAYITHLSLNGYETLHVSGKHTQVAEADIFQSAAPESLLRQVRTTIDKHFTPKHGIHFSGLAGTLTRVMPESFKRSGAALLLSISGFTSDALLLHHGRARRAFSIPFGPRSIVPRLGRELGRSHPVADSLLSLFTQELLIDRVNSEIDRVVTEAENDWQNHWQNENLGKIDSVFFLPHHGEEKISRALISGLWPETRALSLSGERIYSRQLMREPTERLDEVLSGLALFAHSLL